MSEPWHIYLLGGLRAERGPVVVNRFRSQKIGALLAYLALYPDRLHTREELADLFWSEVGQEASRGNLRTALASLRRQLEPPDTPAGTVIVTRGNTHISLNPDTVVTDIAEFETAISAAARVQNPEQKMTHLERVVQLYDGPLLRGYYDTWALNERERFADAYLRAVRQLTLLHESAGEMDTALDLARRAVTADPLQEESHALVLRLLMASGQVTAARRHYEEMARLLKERLDLEPSPSIRALLSTPVPEIKGGNVSLARNIRVESAAQSAARRESGVTVAERPEALPQPRTPVVPKNLPLTLTRFIGREDEIDALRNQLLSLPTRLITITGPGGSGKTRIAIEAARELGDVFAGGIWFVPLTDLRDATLIPEAIADALGVPRNNASLQRIADTLRGGAEASIDALPVLLVLDNFEHLADTGATVIGELMERAPNLHCLVTSRQRLRIGQEREFPLMPLPTPEHPGTPERLLEFPSVQLFVSRAQEVRADFQIDARNATAVAHLCAKLEGIPLAIEIAAALAGILTPAQILDRMDRRLDLLVSRRRDIAQRHRTLRAAMESSVGLLEKAAREFFAALSVFRGSWTLEEAEAILEEPKAPEYLLTLRDHSLIVSIPGEAGGADRFRMLETLREFAAELWKSEQAPERCQALEERHARFFTWFVEEGVPQLVGPNQVEWLRRLEADHDNIRATLDYRVTSGDPAEALRIAGMLSGFWSSRGHLSEGRQRFATLLEKSGDTVDALIRARAMSGAGKLAYLQTDYTAARQYHDACLEIYRTEGHGEGVARTLCELGNTEMLRANYMTAAAFCEESLRGYRALGDKRGMALLLNNLGAISLARGLPEVAKPYLEESLPLSREVGHVRNIALALFNLGTIWQAEGDFVRARAYLEENLAVRRELGELGGMGYGLEGLARLAMDEGRADEALGYFEESLSVRRKIQDRDGIASVQLYRGMTLIQMKEDRVGGYECLRESLEISQATGNRHFFANTLEGLAFLISSLGDMERAVRLWAFVTEERTRLGITVKPSIEAALQEQYVAARSTLGDTIFETAWESGRTLSQAEVADLALSHMPTLISE